MDIRLVWKKSKGERGQRGGGGLYKLLFGDAIVGLIENEDDSENETRVIWALRSRTDAKNPPFTDGEEFFCRSEARCKVEASVIRLLKMMFAGQCNITIDGSAFNN